MALQDPASVYIAANNVEAHLVANALIASGVEAHVTEDVSQAGSWMAGLLPQIHKPQVWVERGEIERARPILDEFERRAAELQNARADEGTALPIEVICEECGASTSFPASQRGSVQQCSQCGAYVDVGDNQFSGEWAEEVGEEVDEEADEQV